MKNGENTNSTEQLLSAFDNLDSIRPSSNFEQSLFLKISATKQQAPTHITTTVFVGIATVFVLINIGFVLSTFNNGLSQPTNRGAALQIISKELLINPISINN